MIEVRGYDYAEEFYFFTLNTEVWYTLTICLRFAINITTLDYHFERQKHLPSEWE